MTMFPFKFDFSNACDLILQRCGQNSGHISPYNMHISCVSLVGIINTCKQYSLQQKVSLYTKWFHWILSEFIGIMNGN
jgi:hypothetical protein